MPNVLLILVQTSISLSQQRHRKYCLDPQIQLPDTATRSRNQNAKCASYLRLEICYNHGNRMRYVLPIRGLTYAIITETECLKCFLSAPEEYYNHGTGMPYMLPYRDCKSAIIKELECLLRFISKT